MLFFWNSGVELAQRNESGEMYPGRTLYYIVPQNTPGKGFIINQNTT